MTRQDQVQVRMEIDGKQSISELGKQELAAYEYRQEIKQIKDEQSKLEKESKNLDKIRERFNKLTREIKEMDAAGKSNTKNYKNKVEKLKEVEVKLHSAEKATKALSESQKRYTEVSGKLDGTKGKIDNLRDSMGVAGMTMRQLRNHQRDLNREISLVTKGTERYKQLEKQLIDVNGRIRTQAMETKGLTSAWSKAAGTIKNFGLIGAGIFTARGMISGLRTTIAVASEFEQSMSNLSAITGAVGEDLDFLRDKAREMGATTTLSAQQTADAFTVIASKKPELLENREALVATTQAAITLAEAAGITLPEAADALTNTLNQFGDSAEEADRYINVLAAGSKFGAGNIEFLNDSIKRFGPIAKQMNISIEESVGIMEVFAEKGLESEKAGTQFRNILLKLAAGADETNPSIVGLETAMDNLGKKNLSTAELTKMFGSENVVAAQIMVNSTERFAEFTDKVTGTGVALEQARTRVDNLKGDFKGLISITSDYLIVMGGWISKGLRPAVQWTIALLKALKETPRFLKENKDLFIALGIALITFNGAQIVATGLMLKDIAVKKAQAIWTGAVTLAQNLLNTAMTANPIGLVVKAVGLLTAGFVILYNRSEKVRAGIAGIAKVALTVWEIVKETFGNITGGFQKIFSGDFAGGLKDIGTAIVKSNPIGLALTEGKRLAGAFAKGYKEKLASEKETVEEANAGLATVPGLSPLDEITEDDTTPDGGGGLSDDEKKNLAAKLEALKSEYAKFQKDLVKIRRESALQELGEEDRELEVNRQKYREMEEEVIRFYEEKLITVAEFEEQLAELTALRLEQESEIRAKYREKEEKERTDAITKVEEASLDERERAFLQTEKYYDGLTELARKHGLDEAGIIAAKNKALFDLNQKHLQEDYRQWMDNLHSKQQMWMAFGDVATSTLSAIGSFTGKMNAFEKETAIFKSLVNTGVAISNIIAAFSATSLTPIDFAIKVATGIATVMANIGTAVRAINSASEPQVPTPDGTGGEKQPTRRGSTAPRKSFYFGGDTSGEGLGFGDQHGEYKGYVHDREYVIPEVVRQNPVVKFHIEPILEALRMKQSPPPSYYYGGPTGAAAGQSQNSPITSQASDTESKALLREIRDIVKQWPKTVRGQWVYNDWEEMHDEMKDLEKRYKA
jgi:TP901 family phage tail tape measure protein